MCRKLFILLFLFTILVPPLFIGCGEKEEPLPVFPNWQKYSYRHFVFHYPPSSIFAKGIGDFAAAYERYLTEDCDYLAMEIPKDTIHFYIHETPQSGQALTGRPLPYSTKNQIHWDGQSPFGLELARFLIRKMDIRMTDFRILYDGLATLLDYSDYDYHHNCISLTEINAFIPLDTLVNNESYARADSLYRNWEGASLVGFITYNFGVNRFKMLWQSTAAFDESVQQLFGVNLKRFEEGWLTFARQYYQGIKSDTLMVDSSQIK